MCMLCCVSVCFNSCILFVIPSILCCSMLSVLIVFIDGVLGREGEGVGGRSDGMG